MEFQYVAGFGPVGTDPDATHAFWATALGIPFEEVAPDYLHARDLDGVKGVRALAADAGGGGDVRHAGVAGRPAGATGVDRVRGVLARGGRRHRAHLREAGQEILVDAHLEPRGQTTARLLSPEGLLVGISYLPDFH